jgi:hypothetical protein
MRPAGSFNPTLCCPLEHQPALPRGYTLITQQMDYWTDDVPQSTGGTLLRHLQFFNSGPDKVRQWSQGSSDGGKTWHTEYDFIYTRVQPKTSQM